MSRPKNESLASATIIVPITQGVGEFSVPLDLKESLDSLFVVPQSIFSYNNFDWKYFLTCNASYHIDKEHVHKENILQSFTSSKAISYFTKITNELGKTPNEIQVYAKLHNSGTKLSLDTSYNGLLILSLFGYRKKKIC